MNRTVATRKLVSISADRWYVPINGDRWLVSVYLMVRADNLDPGQLLPATGDRNPDAADLFDRIHAKPMETVEWLGPEHNPIGARAADGRWLYLYRCSGGLGSVNQAWFDAVDAVMPPGSAAWGTSNPLDPLVIADEEDRTHAIVMPARLPDASLAGYFA